MRLYSWLIVTYLDLSLNLFILNNNSISGLNEHWAQLVEIEKAKNQFPGQWIPRDSSAMADVWRLK